MEIQFQGQYKLQHYLKGAYRASKPAKSTTIVRLISLVFFSTTIISFAVTQVQEADSTNLQPLQLVQYSLMFLIFLFLLFQPLIRSYFEANRMWKDPMSLKSISGRITDQGVTFVSYTQKWENFSRKDAREDLVVLISTDQVMSILPRSFFATNQDWEDFVQLVEKKVREPI